MTDTEVLDLLRQALFDLTEQEFCGKYNLDHWEYEQLHKQYQEM